MDPTPFPRLTGRAEVSVRPASGGDAAAIARIQAVTWRTAYREVLPAELLDGWDEAAAAASWRAAITDPPTPGHGILVAVDGAAVVGFAAYAPAEPHESGAPTAEVTTLLVEPRWGRRGHGSRLLAAVTDIVRDRGVTHLATWLPEADQVSAGFLASAGWEPDGWARTLDTGSTPLREVRLHTDLSTDEESSP